MTDFDPIRWAVQGKPPPEPLRPGRIPAGVRQVDRMRPDYWLAASAAVATGRTLPDPDLPWSAIYDEAW